MRASFGRLRLMLSHQMPSAALFKADREEGAGGYVCVLSIDPCAAGADDGAATRQMLNLPDAQFDNVPKESYLRREDYLDFVVDHEVYHCLSSRYVGPQPMSGEAFWADYHHFLHEKGADAYALAMHIKKHGEITRFAESIQRIRSLALFNMDPNHFTCDALQQVMAMPVEDVVAMDHVGVLHLANKVRTPLDPGYEGSLRYVASSIEAIERLGLGGRLDDELRQRAQGHAPDDAVVQKLVARTQECMRTFQLSPE